MRAGFFLSSTVFGFMGGYAIKTGMVLGRLRAATALDRRGWRSGGGEAYNVLFLGPPPTF
jgi:hypothetical protein